jgi:pimeloyl-ACP methyl ester carboxylesterase
VTRRGGGAVQSITYLHGFASGASSTKGVAMEQRFAEIGTPVRRLELTPGEGGFERSSPLTMLEIVERELVAAPATVLMGSSLGGYLAAMAAARGARVERLVLLAPAFRLAERWLQRMTPEEIATWRRDGLEVDYYAQNRRARIDWRFIEDARALPAYPAVSIPTLCITGVRDELVPLADVEEFVRRTPTARLVTVDDGHELTASIPRIFEEARAFLGL